MKQLLTALGLSLCAVSQPLFADTIPYSPNMLQLEAQLNRGGQFERGTTGTTKRPVLYGTHGAWTRSFGFRVYFDECTPLKGCDAANYIAKFAPNDFTHDPARLAEFNATQPNGSAYYDDRHLIVSAQRRLEGKLSRKAAKSSIDQYLELLEMTNEELGLSNIRRREGPTAR